MLVSMCACMCMSMYGCLGGGGRGKWALLLPGAIRWRPSRLEQRIRCPGQPGKKLGCKLCSHVQETLEVVVDTGLGQSIIKGLIAPSCLAFLPHG